MGTRKEDVTDEISSENLQQKHDPDNVINRSESKDKGSCASLSAEVVSDALQKRLSSDVLAKASLSDQDEGACPTTCQEVSHEVQPRDSVEKGIDASQSNQEVNSLSEVPNKDSEDVHQKKGPESKGGASESKMKGSSASMSVEVVYHELNKRLSQAEVVYHELNKRLSRDACKASESIRDEGAHPAGCQEVSGEAQPRESVDEGINGSQSNQEDSSLSKVPEEGSENVHQKKGPKSEGGASESSQVPFLPKKERFIKACRSESPAKDRNISPVPGKALDSSQQIQSQKMEAVVRPDQEQVTYSTRPEKALNKLQPRRNPDMGVQALPSDLGINPFKAPEKPSEDGYNWRKYGQKLVRGNEFTRSYYRCTHPNCVAKKQVERSHDGHITDIHYIAQHEHPKPLNSPQTPPESVVPMKMRRPDMPMGTPREGEKSVELRQTCQSIKPSESPLPPTVMPEGGCAIDTVPKPHKSGDEADKNGGPETPDSKRQKKEVPRNDDTPPIKYHSEPRHIVQTMSEVDIVNDGYRWRKYGQKMVKGNPNPRSYYRCSSAGCPAKKHVERASHDPKLVITAYEGQHVHDTPPSRTVMQNPAGADSNTARVSGEVTSESGENKHVGIDRVVHIGAN